MKHEHVQWCRNLFESLNDNGIWGLPACGLVFRKVGAELVLIDRLPHNAAMPMTPEELRQYQESEYENNRQHFEAAGIKVRKIENKSDNTAVQTPCPSVRPSPTLKSMGKRRNQ